MEDIKEITQNYFCECCQYQSKIKCNFDKHLLTKKHAKKMNGEESISTEPKIKRTRKSKKNVSEMSIQTDSDIETIVSDITFSVSELSIENIEITKVEMSVQTDEVIVDNSELENENMVLKEECEYLKDNIELIKQEIYDANEEEKYELKNEIENLKKVIKEFENENEVKKLKEIIKDVENENEKLNQKIDSLSDEHNEKIIRELKQDIKGYLCDIDEKDNEIYKLKEEIERMKNEQQKHDVSIAKNETKCVEINNNTNQLNLNVEQKLNVEPTSNVKPKSKNKSILLKIDESSIVSNGNEENDRKIENEEIKILKEQLNDQSNEIKKLVNALLINTNESPKTNKKSSKKPDDEVKIRVDRDVNNYRDLKNMMDLSQFRRLCKNPNFNKYIRYYNHLDVDGNEQNVLLLNNMNTLEQGSDHDEYSDKTYENEIYLDCLIELFRSVNYRHIPFICTNIRNLTFKVFDFEKKEWIELKNKNEFANYIKQYVDILSGFLLKATNNMMNNDYINNSVYKEFYGINRAKYLSSNYLFVLRNIVNPLGCDAKFGKNVTPQRELFMNSLINKLSNMFNMNVDHFTRLEDHDESIDVEIEYYYDLDRVEYVPCHHNLVEHYVKKTDYWNDSD
jgi:hypothetical protein